MNLLLENFLNFLLFPATYTWRSIFSSESAETVMQNECQNAGTTLHGTPGENSTQSQCVFYMHNPPNNIAEDCIAARGPGLRSGKYAGFPTEADKITYNAPPYTVPTLDKMEVQI